jgi:hypothetical protein
MLPSSSVAPPCREERMMIFLEYPYHLVLYEGFGNLELGGGVDALVLVRRPSLPRRHDTGITRE